MASVIAAGLTSGTALAMAGDTSGALQLQTNGTTTAVTIDTSQNVGIGTTSPSTYANGYGPVLVTGTVNNFATVQGRTDGPSGAGNGVSYGGSYSTNPINGARIWMGASGGAGQQGVLLFYTKALDDNTTQPLERMRIDTNGLLMLSTTSALGRFTVSNPSNATVGVFIQSTVAGDVGNDELRIGKYDNNSTSSQIFARFTINNAANGCGSITGNGANSAAFGSFSDERLKENISCLPTQLDNVLALRPVEFDYKDGSGHQIGFIAQEMQAIYPDTVGDDGTEEKILTITGWDKTTARLVKAIQEQQALIIQLQADVAALKGVKA